MNSEKCVRIQPWAIVRAAVGILAALAIAAGCGGIIPGGTPSGPGPEKTEAKLHQIAGSTSTPIYYLGAAFRDWELDDAIIFSGDTQTEGDTSLGPGESVSVGYGPECDGPDCYWRVSVGDSNIPLDGTVAGCSRRAALHGVPTVSIAGDSVILFTAELAIQVGTTPGDVELAAQAAAELRRVGETAPVGALPPPPKSKLKLIDAACGQRPGDHGPELPVDPGVTELPDFTVPRLGGGELRWSDYLGKPVVVVAGDVIQVAPAVRRLAGMTSGGESPPVIGLIWDTLGDKEHPAPAAEIQRKAGPLPVPVGYPATFPAVWLSDIAATDPGQLGVIGFFKVNGTPLTVLTTDASDARLREALQQLR